MSILKQLVKEYNCLTRFTYKAMVTVAPFSAEFFFRALSADASASEPFNILTLNRYGHSTTDSAKFFGHLTITKLFVFSGRIVNFDANSYDNILSKLSYTQKTL